MLMYTCLCIVVFYTYLYVYNTIYSYLYSTYTRFSPSFLPVYRYVPGLQVTKLDENNGDIVRLQSEPTSSIGTSAYIISKSGVDAVLAKHDRDGKSVR